MHSHEHLLVKLFSTTRYDSSSIYAAINYKHRKMDDVENVQA